MNVTEYRGKVVCIFDEYSDVASLEALQKKCEIDEKDFIWVALEGTESANLKPEYSLTENYEHSLINSLMWQGHFTDDEQTTRMWEMIDEFIDNGKQILVEEYEFVEDEPFYDYSGGRD